VHENTLADSSVRVTVVAESNASPISDNAGEDCSLPSFRRGSQRFARVECRETVPETAPSRHAQRSRFLPRTCSRASNRAAGKSTSRGRSPAPLRQRVGLCRRYQCGSATRSSAARRSHSQKQMSNRSADSEPHRPSDFLGKDSSSDRTVGDHVRERFQ